MKKYLKDKTLIYYTINFDYSKDSRIAFKIFAFHGDSFKFGNITGWVNAGKMNENEGEGK